MSKIKTAFLAALAPFGAAINAIKDGYLKAINWVVAHPHRTVWSGFGAIVVALVL